MILGRLKDCIFGGFSLWLMEPCNAGEMNGLQPEWVLTTQNPLKLTLSSLWQGMFQREAVLLALICVHTCVFTYCAHMHAPMHTWRLGVDTGCLLLSLFPHFIFSLRVSPWAWSSLLQLGWLSSNLLGSHLLSGITVGSCMGAGNPNLGVHACIASSSFTVPAPQPSLKS